jgi:SAM-dependent methyltransferase
MKSAGGVSAPSWKKKSDGILRWNVSNRDAWVAAEAARVPAGARVLDVGAGAGPYREIFAHCDYRAHDFAQEPSTIGRYTQLDYCSDITSIPAPDAAFDVILCTEVLEHVPEPIPALREMARLLRPGGTLLLSAPLASYLHQEPFHYYGGYTCHWYRRFLPEAGLRLERVEQNGGFFRLFGQESLRYMALLAPWRLRGVGWRYPFLAAYWLLLFPALAVMIPLAGEALDRLRLEAIATAGYHVVAIREE